MVDYKEFGIPMLGNILSQELEAIGKKDIEVREAFVRIQRVAGIAEELGNKMIDFSECVRKNKDFKHLM